MSKKKLSKPAPMLDQAQIHAAVARIEDIATAAGTQVALVGGVALQHYGSTRFTADIDYLAAAPLPVLPHGDPLSFGGYATQVDGVPVDIILRDDDYAPLYAEALEFAVRGADGIRRASSEYLLVMKLVARRSKDDADFDWLVTSGVCNVPKARRIVRRLLGAYAADDFDAHVASARWVARRNPRRT